MLGLCTALGVGAAAAVCPWPDDLAAGLRGVWTERVVVEVSAGSQPPDSVLPVNLGSALPVGVPVEQIRVALDDGTELLYELRSAKGIPRRQGQTEAGDQLWVPLPISGGQPRRVAIYWGNPAAVAVPEEWSAGLRDGGMELGRWEDPGWSAVSTDELHRAQWRPGEGRQGSAALWVGVASGAPPTWVQWQQSWRSPPAGRTYELSGWIRTRALAGRAGWYVHIHGPSGLLTNQHVEVRTDAFDWVRLSMRVSIPSGAVHLTVGTVLHGTGECWYDDLELCDLSPVQPDHVVVLGRESRPVPAARGPSLKFRDDEVAAGRIRAVRPSAATERAWVVADLRPLGGRWFQGNPGHVRRVLNDQGQEIAGAWAADSWCVVPVYFDRDWQEFTVTVGRGTAAPRRFEPAAAGNLAPPLPNSLEKLRASGWRFTGSTSSCAPRITQDGGPVLEFELPDSERGRWIGWVSDDIPIRPGTRYVLGGQIRATGEAAGAVIHAHIFCTGAAPRTVFLSTSPGAQEEGWVTTLADVRAPLNARAMRLHLTSSRAGHLWHRGVFLVEAVPGEVLTLAAHDGYTGPDPHLWVVHPLVKVFPDDPPPKAAITGLSVRVARGETEALQVVVYAGAKPRRVAVSVGGWSAENVAARTPTARVARVGYVPVDAPSEYYRWEGPFWARPKPTNRRGATDGWAGWWPDPLWPQSTGSVAAGQNQPFWILVDVPPQTPAGRFRAQLRIAVDGVERVVPLDVDVIAVDLPRRPSLIALFDLRRGHRDFGTGMMEPGTEARRQWLRFLAEHRLGVDSIRPAPKFELRGDRVYVDLTNYEAEARYCFAELDMRAAYLPQFFYEFGWAYRPKSRWGLEPFDPAHVAAVQECARQFAQWARAHGWHDRFIHYISDEPHFRHDHVVEQMRRLCQLYHDSGAGFPIYSSTWRYCPAWSDSLDIWGIGQYGCFPVEAIREVQQKGRQVLFTGDGQLALDTPYLAIERLWPYYCFRYGAIGFEFWGVSWWTWNPWQFGWHPFIRQSDDGQRWYYVRYPNGDGYLAYPGEAVGLQGPISSVRLEQVREGLEDYELLRLLQQRVGTRGHPALDQARALVTIPNAGGLRSLSILPEPDRVLKVRSEVLEALSTPH